MHLYTYFFVYIEFKRERGRERETTTLGYTDNKDIWSCHMSTTAATIFETDIDLISYLHTSIIPS